MLKVCDTYEKIMKLLDFKLEKLIIKHLDVLLSYERYMPEKAEKIRKEYKYSAERPYFSKDPSKKELPKI